MQQWNLNQQSAISNSHLSIHRICSGWIPDTRYSSTSPVPAGTSTARSRARLARLDGAVVGVEAKRAGALPSSRWPAAAMPAPRAPAPASPPARRTRSSPARSPGCRCRRRRGRRTRRNPRSAARRRRYDRCCAGRSTSVAPRAASRARSAGVICTPWTASTRASRKPLSSRYCTGLTPGATQAGSQTPSSSRNWRHGPPAV